MAPPSLLRFALVWAASLQLVACGSARFAPAPGVAPHPAPGVAQHPAPAAAAATSATPLYAADEAVRDSLSGRWEYIGKAQWPGINRMYACAFRNDRVIVVNVYCSITESHAFRVDVYSPARGHVRLYAEASGPISAREREDYFTFTAQSELPPGPETRIPALDLSMSIEQLRAYDEQRYEAYLPSCYGGTERSKRQSGCLDELAPRAPSWVAQNRSFLERPSSDWYRLVQQLRTLAVHYGKDPR